MAHVQEAPVTYGERVPAGARSVWSCPRSWKRASGSARAPACVELYPEYLVTSHCIIRASVPLMEAGRERALALADDDPVAAALAPYYEHHIPEELSHHDDWLLDDLEVLGRERSDILSRIYLRRPSPRSSEPSTTGCSTTTR